jgi:hypothetical protein
MTTEHGDPWRSLLTKGILLSPEPWKIIAATRKWRTLTATLQNERTGQLLEVKTNTTVLKDQFAEDFLGNLVRSLTEPSSMKCGPN